ncbi:MAG TPA: helix-turn-helix domain-containing protein [Sphingomicrobium sp.]|nr:helix-turn-helix domain-containing protein [Sphingomicrobium sp.]
MGALGLSGRAVLEALCDIVDDVSGRLEPSIATIADRAKLGIRTVVRALRRLHNHGFLSWLRRTEAIDNDGAGPQVQQVSNAYWFELRGRAAGLVRLLLGRAPPDVRRREELQAIDSRMRSERLKTMRRTGTGVAAGDVLSDEVKASLARLAERRGANAIKAKNPGEQG